MWLHRKSSFSLFYREWFCVCMCISVCASTVFPWCMLTVWQANVHRSNSLRVSDYGLCFFSSLPDYWVQWQTDQLGKGKQLWKGRRDHRVKKKGGVQPVMPLALPCFLYRWHSAERWSNVPLCSQELGFNLESFQCAPILHIPLFRTVKLGFMCCTSTLNYHMKGVVFRKCLICYPAWTCFTTCAAFSFCSRSTSF